LAWQPSPPAPPPVSPRISSCSSPSSSRSTRRVPASGRGGLLAALLDMQRLRGVDGYVQVTMDQTGSGDDMVTVVTAYPFTYGLVARAIDIRVGPPPYGDPGGAGPSVQDEGASVSARLAARRRQP
jgi:hypothetical protein